MKKIILSTAAIVMALSFNSFAGTPETKGEAKPEAKTENQAIIYHATTTNANGSINFVEGEKDDCPPSGDKPCRWESSVPLTSPMTQTQLETNPNVTVTDYRL